jgi:hypothetical protein
MAKIQLRRGTSAAWTAANPTLNSGELGLETDTSKVKVGDGTTTWNVKSYLIDPSITGGAGVVPVGGIIMWSGTIATIPATWALCDGTSNIPGPDLRDKFVVGAKQDDAGIAKSNILGALSQSGGATGHSHSGHGNLTHTGVSVADHTGFTHAVAVANHPDLTHVALASHPVLTIEGQTHANVSLPGYTHPVLTIEGMTHAVQSIASRNDLIAAGATHPLLTIEGMTHAVQSIASRNDAVAAGLTHSLHGVSAFSLQSGTASRISRTLPLSDAHPSHPTNSVTIPAWSISPASHPTFTASAPASHPTGSVTLPAWSISPASHPTFTASAVASHPTAAGTLASHPTMTASGLTHGGVGSHIGTDYGVHSITAPAAHGTAGTVAHSFTQPSDHTVSAHDTVSMVPSFFALAFIQRMS